ncbi:hypothetical protein [Streptosporangium canum]|uniref:hypothetical protein n=1 Tax=Streptosporangium canum TaxID=324952 RepID=UPI0037AB2D5A
MAELSDIEITGTDALRKYVDAARAVAREVAGELEWGAEEISAVLIDTAKGNPLLMGMDVKIRARRIAKRARRAAELQRASAVEMTKLWTDYKIQFAPLFGQKKRRLPKKKVNSDSKRARFDF